MHGPPGGRPQQLWWYPHGVKRLGLPKLSNCAALHSSMSQAVNKISSGNVPVIWLFSRRLRRRGSVARRAGQHRGRGENSQVVQLLELAELGRDRAGDLVVGEVPTTPRVGRAPRRASGTRGELAGTSAPRAGRSRSGSGRSSRCCRATCDAEGRSRAAPGVGDAGGARSSVSAESWPISVGIGPVR